MLSTLNHVLRRSHGLSDISRRCFSSSLSQLKNGQQSSRRLRYVFFPTKLHSRFFKTAVKEKRGILPVDEIEGAARKGFGCLFRPFLFTVTASCAFFSGAAIWQYENLLALAKNNSNWNKEMFYGKAGSFRQLMNETWNRFTPGQRVVSVLIAMNVGVYLAWRVSALNSFMYVFFTASPFGATPCMSMLLSSFSHHSFFHLMANMYVLWSFTPTISSLLGPEQFLATYLSAALVSGLGSYALKVARGSLVPSLGASGAIIAMLGIVCLQYPEARLSIAFVDQIFDHSFSAGSAMKGLILLDTLGVLFRWHLFDHAAHLAGMFFGLWYITYGHKYIWNNRKHLVRKWHALRTRPSSD